MYKYKSCVINLIKNYKEKQKQVIEFLKELKLLIDNEGIMSYRDKKSFMIDIRNNLKYVEGCVKNGR